MHQPRNSYHCMNDWLSLLVVHVLFLEQAVAVDNTSEKRQLLVLGFEWQQKNSEVYLNDGI